jgi:hypothetical protein
MRISIDPDDPGYRDDATLWRVLVDGEIVHDCITADDCEGFALRYAPAAHDVMPHLPAALGRTPVERITGAITIERMVGI